MSNKKNSKLDSKEYGGLINSSDSFFIYNSIKNDNAPSLIVTSSEKESKRITSEISTFSKEIASKLIYIPQTDEMPYDEVDSSLTYSSKKNFTLCSLIDNKERIVVTSIKNLHKRLIKKEILKSYSLNIKLNNNININELNVKLKSLNYKRVSEVLYTGDYSVRGSIIDIFPGGYDIPFRIDLNDTQVETICPFSLETQISNTNDLIDEILIVPLSDIIVNKNTIKNFRHNFRSMFEGNPQDDNNYINFSNEIIPQGFNNFFPIIYESTSIIFDYLENIEKVFIFDNYCDSVHEYSDYIEERFEQSYKDNKNILDPNLLFLDSDSIIKKLGKMDITQIHKDKKISSSINNINISSVKDLSIKPFLKNPLESIESIVNKNYHINLFYKNNEELKKISELFQVYKILYVNSEQYGKQIDLGKINLCRGHIDESFIWNDLNYIFISLNDIFKTKIRQKLSHKKSKRNLFLDQLKNLDVGSAVVHEIHGIGRYGGLKQITVNDNANEYLTIIYEDNDKLYVPVSSLHLVNKYISNNSDSAPLHKLGSSYWNLAKSKAAKKAYDIAAEILETNARRTIKNGYKYDIDQIQMENFNSEFIYDETEDQESAIDDVIKDLRSDKLMDRLVCGDVGFGKTEVALRASFIVSLNSKQVAIIAPTTLLVDQHEKVFKERFKKWPITISSISRFKNKSSQKNILDSLKNGKIDIIIGTHRLLQKDISFNNLGLLVIDEEQKFGVKHKELIKKIKNDVDVMTLSATPIPRTLNMSLGGLKDLSIIATSPENRNPIKTYNTEWSDTIIKDVCTREINRGGQVFFIHNRIQDINIIFEKLSKLMPNYKIKVAHAKLKSDNLEKIILDFYEKKFNILISTTIIENGIDIPNANTIIINRADKFGLSQLHQIRGRVGRSEKQAYCYLVVNNKKLISSESKKRLQVLESMEDLGSGFSIATRDLEIRGAGELLGESQSGEIQEIGFNLYNRILTKAIRSIKTGELPKLDRPLDTGMEIDLNVETLIPIRYIDDINLRLVIYKKIANAEDIYDLEEIIKELINKFGKLPEELINLIEITKIKLDYSHIGIQSLSINNSRLKIEFQENPKINKDNLLNFINNHKNRVSFTKDSIFTYKEESIDLKSKMEIIHKTLRSLC